MRSPSRPTEDHSLSLVNTPLQITKFHTQSDALAGSIIFHIISYLFVMVAGVFALHRLGMKFGDLKRGC